MTDYTRKKIKVEYRDPNDLIPYDNNARTHMSEVEFLCNSIKENGFDVGHAIGVDKNGVIIYGHGRRLAAIKLGMKEVPVVVRGDLSPQQVKAYRLADNKLTDLSGWDFDKLEIELDELKEMKVDMSQFGFDDLEFLDDDEEESAGVLEDTQEDDEKAPEVEQDGPYRIMITCPSQEDQMELFNSLRDQGVDCQIVG